MEEFLDDHEYYWEPENVIKGGTPIDVNEIIKKREFYNLYETNTTPSTPHNGFIEFNQLLYDGTILILEGHQRFVKNIMSPETPHKRLLVYHNTGSGKTVTMLGVAKTFISYFKYMRYKKRIIIIGATEDVIIADLIKFPYFGFVTRNEVETLNTLKEILTEAGKQEYKSMYNMLRRRIITDQKLGMFMFMGYQKFAYELIHITTKGIVAGITLNYVYDDDDTFLSKINTLLEKKYIVVNHDLLDKMRDSLFVCDEIHNIYNTKSKNNRGIAIKYALDVIENTTPQNTPKCLFLSATPLSGSPTEVVDLINILIPGSEYKRSEFFDDENLKDGALQRISDLCKGYVSFLKDTSSKMYPTKIMVGDDLKDVPYIKVVKCNMGKIMVNMIQKYFINNVLPIKYSSLVDIIFPDPSCDVKSIVNNECDSMLANVNDMKNALYDASAEWKQKIGITINGEVLSGDFLILDNLKLYSEKYYTLVKDILDIIKSGIPGKILVYHKYVSGTGIMFIREILLKNGILDMKTDAIGSTLCSICGTILRDHKSRDHSFSPCRCVLVYGDSELDNDTTLMEFHADNNLMGYKYRILLGSKLVQEGVNFSNLRFLKIVSIPTDISTLIQIIGRAARHGSHIMLPQKYRTVEIKLYMHYADNIIGPEQYNLTKKMRSFLLIQKIQHELMRYAVDNFVNYHKFTNNNIASMDGIPYMPSDSLDKKLESKFTSIHSIPKEINFSYYAIGHSSYEIKDIIILIKKLFSLRPVWKYNDLWSAVKNPDTNIISVFTDTCNYLEGNFKIALQMLINAPNIHNHTHTSHDDATSMYIYTIFNKRIIVKMGNYFILVPVDNTGFPILSPNSFMRNINDIALLNIPITQKIYNDYAPDTSVENIQTIIDNMLSETGNNMINVLFVLSHSDHIATLQYLITGELVNDRLLQLYSDLKIILHIDLFKPGMLPKGTSNKYIGYIDNNVVYTYIANEWVKLSDAVLNIQKPIENDIILGILYKNSFKLKLPSKLFEEESDARKKHKGSECTSYSVGYRKDILTKLGVEHPEKNVDLCNTILQTLLDKEIDARINNTGVKWLYLFNEIPNI